MAELAANDVVRKPMAKTMLVENTATRPVAWGDLKALYD